MRTLIITRPDDWHVHLRDDETLNDTVPATAKHFARALVMPNLQPPLTSVDAILQYRQRILTACAHHHTIDFIPYTTFFLNETVSADELTHIKNPYILGGKLYPKGATTHSEHGASSIQGLYPLLEIMQANDLVLQIHGETTHGDIFEREALFIENVLTSIIRDFPKLRIVLEHISTKHAVEFVSQAPTTVAATITPHHLWYNRNHLLVGGLKPHYYCLPILKHENDQKALQQAAISRNPKFFAGTDSAPHPQQHKESACGCAGIYSAPYALSLYTEIFDQLEELSCLNDFMGRFGAEFYQLPITQTQIELIEKPQTVPNILPFANHQTIIPMAAGHSLRWSIVHDRSH